MSNLAVWALVFGVLKGIGGVWMLRWPASARAALQAFPRSVWPGRIMAVGAFAWAAWLIHGMPMSEAFAQYKGLIWLLCPALILLVWFFMEEFLSVRALGGLLLLLPSAVLAAARWHPSSWRHVMSLSAYLAVFAGMALILMPYMFRKMVALFFDNDQRARMAGVAGCVAGAAFLGLAFLVY